MSITDERAREVPEGWAAIELAARYVLENSRRGNASLSDEQFAADTASLMKAYRDIIGKALMSGHLALASAPAPAPLRAAGEAERNQALEDAAREVEGLKRRIPYEYNQHPCSVTKQHAAFAIRALKTAQIISTNPTQIVRATPPAPSEQPAPSRDEVERLRRQLDDHSTALVNLTTYAVTLRDTLQWYGEQARLARLIHSEGDAGRHALSEDGGKRASTALKDADRAVAAESQVIVGMLRDARTEVWREAIAIADDFAIEAKALEAKAREKAALDKSTAGKQVEAEEAVSHARCAAIATDIARALYAKSGRAALQSTEHARVDEGEVS